MWLFFPVLPCVLESADMVSVLPLRFVICGYDSLFAVVFCT